MKFTYSGITYYLQFRHVNPSGPGAITLDGRKRPNRYTNCKIITWEGKQVLVFDSYDFPGEANFCKEVGRKAALRGALSGQPRLFRTTAWMAYINRGFQSPAREQVKAI